METYSNPASPIFNDAMIMAEKLNITECIALAAQCGVTYNPLLASKLTRYEILESVWFEGNFTEMHKLINEAT